jgi:hypothetical protein
MRYTVYRIIVCSRTKIRMISFLRNLCVRILDADRFTIVVFQILDIKSNYLPGIVHVIIHHSVAILYYKIRPDCFVNLTRQQCTRKSSTHFNMSFLCTSSTVFKIMPFGEIDAAMAMLNIRKVGYYHDFLQRELYVGELVGAPQCFAPHRTICMYWLR